MYVATVGRATTLDPGNEGDRHPQTLSSIPPCFFSWVMTALVIPQAVTMHHGPCTRMPTIRAPRVPTRRGKGLYGSHQDNPHRVSPRRVRRLSPWDTKGVYPPSRTTPSTRSYRTRSPCTPPVMIYKNNAPAYCLTLMVHTVAVRHRSHSHRFR
jgi:hypothetical protein